MVRKQKELHVGLALSIRKIPERDRRSMSRPYVHARFIFRMEWQNRDKKEEEEEDKRNENATGGGSTQWHELLVGASFACA